MTTKVEKFECDDKYEAEKLVGLLSVQKDNFAYLHGVAGIIQNEIVIILKDRSSHSILLKDNNTAIRLRKLIEDIGEGTKTIYESSFHDDATADIILVINKE